LLLALLSFCCSEKKKLSEDAKTATDSLKVADSIKVLADNSKIKVFADYNLNSRFHEDQKKSFNYWNYDTAYYAQRIVAQNQNRKKGKLTVPDGLKGTWIPVYALDSVFYVQKDCDHQWRFSVNDSTFNFFDGMMVVEPYVMDKIKMKTSEFEITTRASKKIEMTRVDDQRMIYKVAIHDERCFYVTQFSDFNKFPILVVECKGGAVPLEAGVNLDTVYCELDK